MPGGRLLTGALLGCKEGCKEELGCKGCKEGLQRRILPHAQCQADAYFVDAPVGAEQALPAAGAHRYTTRGSIGWAAGPKSAVRPRAAHHVLVNLVAPEAGFEPYRALKVQEVLIKQARGHPSHSLGLSQLAALWGMRHEAWAVQVV